MGSHAKDADQEPDLTTVRRVLKQEPENEQFVDEVTDPALPLAKLKAALKGRVSNDR